MEKTVLNPREVHSRWSDVVSERGANSKRITHRQNLSFLSVKGAVNSYPDTGESGDAYNVDMG